MKRKYPVGCEIFENQGAHFRVWAPDHEQVYLVMVTDPQNPVFFEMQAEENGYFSLWNKEAKIGDLYLYALDKSLYPDPASRYLPSGPNGPSMVIDLDHPWSDHEWTGSSIDGQVIYEMHFGTFTEEGTIKSAKKRLPYLSNLGITIIELMPLNEFPGKFGWGYDGVNFFAPSHLYGTPYDLKDFINSAHKMGMGVILDIVYNHIGPAQNFYPIFSKKYLSDQHFTDWGPAINFENKEVRNIFLNNVRYWIEEFHFDGFRFDAIWTIVCSKKEFIPNLLKAARKAAKDRKIVVIGECEPQDVKYLRPIKDGGYGFDALWNDDFHHSAKVRLTGMKEGYYTDYSGSPQEFISCFKYGFLYQGQYYSWQKQPRGTSFIGFSPSQVVVYLENHDQIANTQGKHLWTYSDKGNLKALTVLLLLSPSTPMLFQGQEYGADTPFIFFADQDPNLIEIVQSGRKKFLEQFYRYSEFGTKVNLGAEAFNSCKMNFKELEKNQGLFCFHRDLITLRKTDPVFKDMQKNSLDGAVLSDDVFLIRYFNEREGDRLLIFNLGKNFSLCAIAEPLLAPREGEMWEILFSSEPYIDQEKHTFSVDTPNQIIGHSAIVLKSKVTYSSAYE